MNNFVILELTWAKAYGEIYCHHASLFIPQNNSLFSPDTVYIGITIRTNIIEKGNIISSIDNKIDNFLHCIPIVGGLRIPLNSTKIIEAISLNSWTTLKGKKRGTPKEFPLSFSYKVENCEEQYFYFDIDNNSTPYLACEDNFAQLREGEKFNVALKLEQ